MKYLIDEKELKEMLNQYLLSSADNIEDDVCRLLFDKAPVECVAEGKLELIETKIGLQLGFNGTGLNYYLDYYNGKNIKLYIIEEE